jgi:hypothetical protein
MASPAGNAVVNATEGQRPDQQPQTQNGQRVRFAEAGQQTQPSASVNNTQPPSSPANQQQ